MCNVFARRINWIERDGAASDSRRRCVSHAPDSRGCTGHPDTCGKPDVAELRGAMAHADWGMGIRAGFLDNAYPPPTRVQY
jgi:hypothetical protein